MGSFTLKLVHPMDRTPKEIQSSAVRSARIYTLEKMNNNSANAWHNTGEPAQQGDYQVSFEDNNVHILDKPCVFYVHNVYILDREDRLFERGVKQAINERQY